MSGSRGFWRFAAGFGAPCLAMMWLVLFVSTVIELNGGDLPLMESGLDVAGAGAFAPAVASIYLIMLAFGAFIGLTLWMCATVAGRWAAHRHRYPLAFGFSVPGDLLALVVAVSTRAFLRGFAISILVVGVGVTVIWCAGLFGVNATESRPSVGT